MGKGDIKTAKGKRARGSYGNSRKRKAAVSVPVVAKKSTKVAKKEEGSAEKPKKSAPKTAAKKTTAKKTTKSK